MTLGSFKWLVGMVVLAVSCPALAADEIRFNRDVRPILSDNCFLCHGPDKSHRKAKFRLDERESALAKKAIVPGDVEKSEAIKRIFTEDADDHMPPLDSGKKLTATQREVLKTWVAQGAKYEPHWAYVVPTRPDVPAVKNGGWVRNPVDAFILSPLEAKGIAPSKEADRRTLLRRVSLDLIGLPPTDAEVEAFVRDSSPDAYAKQVDRLLASPHFGERMAVGWLDLARYADTVGYHGDQNQHNFPYRDYVINAFNSNKRFDQFTIEQLVVAGGFAVALAVDPAFIAGAAGTSTDVTPATAGTVHPSSDFFRNSAANPHHSANAPAFFGSEARPFAEASATASIFFCNRPIRSFK